MSAGDLLAASKGGDVRWVAYTDDGAEWAAPYLRGSLVGRDALGFYICDSRGKPQRLRDGDIDLLRSCIPEWPVWPPVAELAASEGDKDTDYPTADPAIFHGPAGDFAKDAAPHTEADPIAVLASVLAGFGCALGHETYAYAGNDRHPGRLFVVVVGNTTKGAKGTSWRVAEGALEVADPLFVMNNVMAGFGSGEALVDELRDDAESGDHRRLIREEEFARILRVAAREGSTLSMIIRYGWDGRPLEVRSRAGKSIATQHHLGMVAHITRDELKARTSDIEAYNGFLNRNLFVCSSRANRLPQGGNVPTSMFNHHGSVLYKALAAGRRRGQVERTPAAEERWADCYHRMADDDPGGLLGAVIARDAPQTLRLSLLYAVLDQADAIDVQHVESAYAFWRYCRDSAAYIFGDSQGDDVSDRLLTAIRRNPSGLTLTEQHDVFGRNVSKKRLAIARELLERQGLIRTYERETERGRPATVSVATNQTKDTK